MSMDLVSNIIWTIVNSSNHAVSNTFVCENMIILDINKRFLSRVSY